MATVIASGVTFDTNAGSHTVTLTPLVGELLVVMGGNSGLTSDPACTDDNSAGKYTLITGALSAASVDKQFAFVRNSLIAASASTIITMTGAASSGGGMVVIRIREMQRTGASAVRQSAIQQNQGAATPGPVFGLAPLAANMVLGSIFNASNPAALTAPASFTEAQDTGYNVPATGIEVVSRNSGQTSATITWGGASATAFSSIVIELDVTQGDDVSGSSLISHNPF